MSRKDVAQALGSASTWALRSVFHRQAENFPGKVGLLADPNLIADLRSRISEGAVVVVGTNGKTTVTNLLANALEASGKTVACNRTGANLDSGVASTLLHTRSAEWGVFESDELWLAKTLPQLQPDFVVLLNLFRDQLDRAGEIELVQQRIIEALATSPKTVLIYNADDPFCQAIADRSGSTSIPFGVSENLGLTQNTIADSSLCQACDATLDYSWRQYGQLGVYRCPKCGFARKEPTYHATDVHLGTRGVSFTMHRGNDAWRHPEDDWRQGDNQRRSEEDDWHIESPLTGAYMVYNLLATCVAADCCRLPVACAKRAIHDFAPENGRLQTYRIGARTALLNLAKNPVGFNQNLRIISSASCRKAIAFFINDKEADGRDVSWLWDVDFQELAQAPDIAVFAGGIRRNDLQVRLKYAGIDALLVSGARDFVEKAHETLPNAKLFLIANYTALPEVKAVLDEMARDGFIPEESDSTDKAYGRLPVAESFHTADRMVLPETKATLDEMAHDSFDIERKHQDRTCTASDEQPREPARPFLGQTSMPSSSRQAFTIIHLYPELLNLYGDGGNVTILANRARKRGIDAQVVRAARGERIDFDSADIIFLGGGPDREQRLASLDLLEQTEALRSYVEDDGVLLAICGGYQILGHEWLLGDECVPGLGILDITTKRAEGGSHNRLVGNIALDCSFASMPVIGYENHAGRTFLGSECTPFGHVVNKSGNGNNDVERADGARYRNVVGTYLHGPLLAKSPEVADWLINQALTRQAAKQGTTAPPLAPLDDSVEQAANAFMRAKLNIKMSH